MFFIEIEMFYKNCMKKKLIAGCYKFPSNVYTSFLLFALTLNITSIRYAKENDREKRERKVEGEI